MSHDQLEILRRAAAPLRPEDRDESLRVIADRLRTCPELGNGVSFASPETFNPSYCDR
jgi:hypothetical protein